MNKFKIGDRVRSLVGSITLNKTGTIIQVEEERFGCKPYYWILLDKKYRNLSGMVKEIGQSEKEIILIKQLKGCQIHCGETEV